MTAAEKRAKADRQKKYEWIFLKGKQVRIKRLELIEGMLVDDWIEQNADDIWLTQNGMYEVLDARRKIRDGIDSDTEVSSERDESDIPF